MAGIGGPLSWVEASRRGVLELDRVVAENPGEDLILLGYSGGNRVVHEWLILAPICLTVLLLLVCFLILSVLAVGASSGFLAWAGLGFVASVLALSRIVRFGVRRWVM